MLLQEGNHHVVTPGHVDESVADVGVGMFDRFRLEVRHQFEFAAGAVRGTAVVTVTADVDLPPLRGLVGNVLDATEVDHFVVM